MTTYAELKAQGEALLAQAEELRKQEIAGVISDIKAKVKEFGLTADDLGFGSAQPTKKKTGRAKTDAQPKYRGPNGELWAGGLGRKPEWVRDLLAAGKSLDDYLI